VKNNFFLHIETLRIYLKKKIMMLSKVNITITFFFNDKRNEKTDSIKKVNFVKASKFVLYQ